MIAPSTSPPPVSRNLLSRLRHFALPGAACGQQQPGCPVDALRQSLARETDLLHQKEALLRDQELLRQESDHRILNGLQIVISLLWLQSRGATNPDTAAQLGIAANRVATIERIHRRLHSQDGTRTVVLNQYLHDLCLDFTNLSTSREMRDLDIRVEDCKIEIPTATAVSLGFIVSELLTNAVKHGDGRITVELSPAPDGGYALSVSNDGPPLPVDYDPAQSHGLGMKIIRSLVAKIGGEFRFGRSQQDQGARFTLLFT
jgi:two-component sensor histidine kinase